MKLIVLLVALSISSLGYANDQTNIKQSAKESVDVSLEVKPYTALRGSTLRGALRAWSLANNYSLNWEVVSEEGDVVDWPIDKKIVINGTFYDAVVTLLRSYKSINTRLAFNTKFFRNRVLRVYLEDAL